MLKHDHADGAYGTIHKKGETDKVCTPPQKSPFRAVVRAIARHSGSNLSGQLLNVLQKRQQSESRTAKRHCVHFGMDLLSRTEVPEH